MTARRTHAPAGTAMPRVFHSKLAETEGGLAHIIHDLACGNAP